MEVVRPEEVGLSSQRLARIPEHLERRYLDQKKIAGAVTLVARRGRVAHLSALGMMDLARGVPMRDDARPAHAHARPHLRLHGARERRPRLPPARRRRTDAHASRDGRAPRRAAARVLAGDIAASNLGRQFTEVTYEGAGFGLGFSVTLDLARARPWAPSVRTPGAAR